jgi:hypothetical protein
MFPVDHIVQGKFVASFKRGKKDGTACDVFVKNIFDAAAGGKGAPAGELTYEALWKTVKTAGYEAEGGYGSQGDISPDYGFIAKYTKGGDFNISFLEFDSAEKAKAYKAGNDGNREVCVAEGRFAAHIFDTLKKQEVDDIRAFCEGIFKAAKEGGAPAKAKDGGNVGAFSWTGKWEISGTWGTMELVQTGKNVTGTYTWEQGAIEGTVAGNVLTAIWHQKGNNRKGDMEIAMSADGTSLGIKWKYEGANQWRDETDTGTRMAGGDKNVGAPLQAAAANTGGLSLDSLRKAAEATGYKVEGGFTYSGFAPDKGFTVKYDKGGKFDISFVEFASPEKALDYKSRNKKDFEVCIAQDRYAAHYMGSMFDDVKTLPLAEIRAYAEGVFKAAGGGAVAAKVEAAPVGLTPRDELAKKLPNFKIAATMAAPDQNPYHILQSQCAEGAMSEMKGDRASLSFVDFKNKKGYMLDAKNKTGKVMAMPPGMPIERVMGFDRTLASWLYMFQDKMEDMDKTGTEKLLGRPTTVYAMKYGAMVSTMWLDDEYGFPLKVTQVNPGFTVTVTEFKAGGVTLKDMVNLGEYKIEEANDDD